MKTNKIHNNLVSWGCMINSDKWQKSILILVSKMHIPSLLLKWCNVFVGFQLLKNITVPRKKIEASERERSGRKLWLSFSPLEKVVQPRCKRSSMYSFYAENSSMKP